jgi:hypothetical protein
MKRKEPASGASPYLDSNLNTLAALRNVERQQRRKIGKAMVLKRDSICGGPKPQTPNPKS